VQWEFDDGTGFKNAPGTPSIIPSGTVTATIYSFSTALGQNGYRYRAVFTEGGASVPSGIATLTVLNYALLAGRVEVDVILDGVLNPYPATPTASQMAFTAFWNNPEETVRYPNGIGQLLDGSVNAMGRSPVKGQTYPDACPPLSTMQLAFPFDDLAPTLSFQVTPQPTSALHTYHGTFVLLPSTGQLLDASGTPASLGIVNNACLPYWVDLRHDLTPDGRKHYYVESFRSDALLPYNAANFLRADERTVQNGNPIIEKVGALRVRAFCDPADGTGLAPLKVKSAFIEAILEPSPISPLDPDYWALPDCDPPYAPRRGQAGTVQASVRFSPTVATELNETFLVRAGRSYKLKVEFTVGDEYGDVTAAYETPPTMFVSQGVIVDVDVVVDTVFCDSGDGCHSAIGRLEMKGAPGRGVFLNTDAIPPNVRVLDGPFGTSRYAVIDEFLMEPGYITPIQANYKLLDVLPSVAVFPQTWTTKKYRPYAQFYFQTTGGHFEYMDVSAPELEYKCTGYGTLEQWFVMDPGFLTGNIHLEGPSACDGTALSCLALISANDLTESSSANNFFNAPDYSIVTAYRPVGPGNAISVIRVAARSPTSFDAQYELWLAGNEPGASAWKAGGLVLRMGPGSYLGITDRLVSGSSLPDEPLIVSPQAAYQDDLNYCVSEVTLTLVNQTGLQIALPNAEAIGSYGRLAPQPDPLDATQVASYDVVSSFRGTPSTYLPGNASIRLCLPQGNYTLRPEVNLRDPMPPFTEIRSGYHSFSMSVGCRQCYSVTVTPESVGPMIGLKSNPSECTSQATYALEGSVQADVGNGHLITEVSYNLNNVPSILPLYAGPGVASLDLATSLQSLITLNPCVNTIEVTALDNFGLTASATLTVTFDNTPPSLTVPTIALALGCNPAVLPDDASVALASVASDTCGAAAMSVTHADTTVNCLTTRDFTVVAMDDCHNTTSLHAIYSWTVDTAQPTLTAGTIAACYPDVASAEAAALNATGANDICSPVAKSVSTVGECQASITVRGTAACGSYAEVSYHTRIDHTAPVLTGCANITVPSQTGAADATVSFLVTASDDCDGNLTPVCSPPSNSSFAIGTTAVNCMVSDSCGHQSTCTFNVAVVPSGRAEGCSLTQGFYGNANNKFNGTVSSSLLNSLLQPPMVVGKLGLRSLTIPAGDASLLQQRMPAGGPSSILPISGDRTLATVAVPLSKGRFINALLAQTITLSLNVRLDANLLNFPLPASFCTQGVLPGADGKRGTSDDTLVAGEFQLFIIPGSVLAALSDAGLGILNGKVQGLLELANRALADLPTGSAGLSDINAAVDAINRGFDECRVLVDCVTHVPGPPSVNDHFGQPILLSGGGGSNPGLGIPSAGAPVAQNEPVTQFLRTKGFNGAATKEPGEPDIAGNGGGRSVWWQWGASHSGGVRIGTAGSSFDTLLGVYAGESLSNLTLIASSDDISTLVTSEVTFRAAAGTNYLIVVDGYDGASGDITLQLVAGEPRLGPVTLLAAGSLKVGIEGELGCCYTVEGSTDLVTWTLVATGANTNGNLQFVDPEAEASNRRFYRVMFEP
jgi:hypothetical protein